MIGYLLSILVCSSFLGLVWVGLFKENYVFDLLVLLLICPIIYVGEINFEFDLLVYELIDCMLLLL